MTSFAACNILHVYLMDHKSGEPVSFSLKYKGNSEIPTLGLKNGMKLKAKPKKLLDESPR